VRECDKHVKTFNQLSSQFSSETINQWLAMITAWDSDHSKPNPYEEVEEGNLLRIMKLISIDIP
jgi:hypothetical protein